MQRHPAGFTLVELLMALLIVSAFMAATLKSLALHSRVYAQQDGLVAREQNLRIAMSGIADAVRGAGYGVPTAALPTWIPWVAGFTTNPRVNATAPASIDIAQCTAEPVAILTNAAAAGTTTLAVRSANTDQAMADLLDTNAKRLVVIGGTEHAHVTLVGGTSITIDTNPSVSAAQGLARAYPAGTPLCRVDVTTFAIEKDATGMPHLVIKPNNGGPTVRLAEAIEDLRIAVTDAGRRHTLTLTARTERSDPLSGKTLTHSTTFDIVLRNGA